MFKMIQFNIYEKNYEKLKFKKNLKELKKGEKVKISKDIIVIVMIIAVLTFISTTPNIENNQNVTEVKEVSNDKIIKVNMEVNNSLIIKQYKVFERYGSQKFLLKYESFFPVVKMLEKILKENNLDPDLVFLAYIESEFTISARSHRNAVGLWQFTSYTGREIGLRINKTIDERKDIYKSTLAFVKHFKFLYEYYESLDLALAAYNCGIGRLNKAIKEGKTKDFWQLVKLGLLPVETKYYVPKFYAIVKWVNDNKDKFDFEYSSNLVVAKTNSSTNLYKVFDLKNKTIKDTIFNYNKHIYSYKIPSNTYILLPQELLWEKNHNLNKLNIVYYFIPDIFEMKLNNYLNNKSTNLSINKNGAFSDYLNLSFSVVFNKNIKE